MDQVEEDIGLAAKTWAAAERQRMADFLKLHGLPEGDLPRVSDLEIAFFAGASWNMKRESARDDRRHARDMAKLQDLAKAALEAAR